MDRNPLKQAREGKNIAEFVEATFKPGRPDARYCDFCGAEIYGVEYETLVDGRDRCLNCGRTAIKTGEEFRKIFGIYDRALSKTEAECFERWSREYGYFTEIVGEAYDLAVMGGYKKLVFQANRLLTRWYETGCRTVADCRARFEEDEAEKKRERENSKREKKAAEKPRDTYSDFDPEEALRLALERSFGSDDDDDNK